MDARPLIEFGLLDLIEWSSPSACPSYGPSEHVFNWLGDEGVYGSIVRSLCDAADLAAAEMAAELGGEQATARHAFDETMRRWHLALWRLADSEIALVENDVASTVLAAVQPRLDGPGPPP